jgi:predicted nucleic acid-binding protein
MLKGSLPEVFLDTDVCFDIVSKREPHFEHSIKLLELAADDRISLMISESSLANLIYLSFDIYKIEHAAEKLVDFIRASNVVSSGKPVILQALESSFKDKEDALQYYSAQHHEADYFVTRNLRDYKNHLEFLTVLSPKEFMDSIGSEE